MLTVHGLGIVFARGRGTEAFAAALRAGWAPPGALETPLAPAPVPAYCIAPEALADKDALRAARRADRFTRMAVLAATDALHDATLPAPDPLRVGLVLASAFGPHVTTFKFLDDILDFGDLAPSPTTFSHSVHNAAASYIALAAGLRGPCLTLTHFAFAFHHALAVAEAWLTANTCDRVLVGAAEECGTVMAAIAARKLRFANDGKIRPFDFADSPVTVPGEGSVFLCVSHAPSAQAYGAIETDVLVAGRPQSGCDLLILDADGMAASEGSYRSLVQAGIPCAGYAPVFGAFPTGSACGAAAALLMLRQQCVFPCPVTHNPHGLRLADASTPAPRHIRCQKTDCTGQAAGLTLQAIA